GDADDVEGAGRPVRQRYTGVGGHGGHGRDARDDVEVDAGLVQRGGLLREAVEGRGVPVHETDDEAALVRLCGLDDELGPGGVGQLLTVLPVARVDDVDPRSGHRGDVLLIGQ